MTLQDLLRHVDVLGTLGGSTGVEVRSVTRDSRQAGEGAVFVAIAGTRVDGHDFVAGLKCAAVVVEREVQAEEGVVVVRVASTRAALGPLAAAIHGQPSHTVKVVGLTGTNGKTTVTTLIDEALGHLGRVSARIGTTGTFVGGRAVPSELTTPMADDLQRLLATTVDAGALAVSIEVSSIGLHQHRVGGVRIHTAVFTNLSQDHLDYHGTLDAYRNAKSLLFSDSYLRPPGGAVRALLCADDPAWPHMHAPADRWLYGFDEGADVRVTSTRIHDGGMSVAFTTPMGDIELHSRLVGRYNAQNLAAALGVLLTLEVPLAEAGQALAAVAGVPGRLESIPNERDLLVLVDYAHTPDALRAVLSAMREVARGRLICVFGCGGDRDADKRPLMGAAVAELADVAVVTSDNPRSEDPQSIIDAVVSGMARPADHIDIDRRSAIGWAIAQARAGDVVVIAGKGHETTQEISGVKHPFDDRQVARAALEGTP